MCSFYVQLYPILPYEQPYNTSGKRCFSGPPPPNSNLARREIIYSPSRELCISAENLRDVRGEQRGGGRVSSVHSGRAGDLPCLQILLSSSLSLPLYLSFSLSVCPRTPARALGARRPVVNLNERSGWRGVSHSPRTPLFSQGEGKKREEKDKETKRGLFRSFRGPRVALRHYALARARTAGQLISNQRVSARISYRVCETPYYAPRLQPALVPMLLIISQYVQSACERSH